MTTLLINYTNLTTPRPTIIPKPNPTNLTDLQPTTFLTNQNYSPLPTHYPTILPTYNQPTHHTNYQSYQPTVYQPSNKAIHGPSTNFSTTLTSYTPEPGTTRGRGGCLRAACHPAYQLTVSTLQSGSPSLSVRSATRATVNTDQHKWYPTDLDSDTYTCTNVYTDGLQRDSNTHTHTHTLTYIICTYKHLYVHTYLNF